MRDEKASGFSRKVHKTENGRANKDEREVVLLALLSYEKNKTFSNVLVKRTLDACGDMNSAERAFIKRLLEGVIERAPELDAEIVRFTGRPVRKLHPAVHQILRMGIYQIYYMDAVPDSAACNESVRLAKRHAPARLSGFVNGVLRSASRERAAKASLDDPLRSAGQTTAAQSLFEPLRGTGQTGTLKKDPNGSSGTGTLEESKEGMEEAPGFGQAEEAQGFGQAEEARILALERRYSMPAWIIRMWEEQLGQAETEKLLASLLEIRPVCARFCRGVPVPAASPAIESVSGVLFDGSSSTVFDPAAAGLPASAREALLEKIRMAGAVVEDGRWLPDSFRLRKTSDLRLLPGFREGLWTVQDESSMLAVEAAGLSGSEKVYDICAAPGGKTFRAAEKLLQGGGSVHAFDLTCRKTDRIREGAARLHLPNIAIGERDARVFYPADEALFDVMLCDLPCSGLGVIGKKRDIKYRASLEGIRALQKLQREILMNAVRYVKPGGVLVYSTCTISARENEENAAWIEETLGLHPEDLTPFLPDGIPGVRGNMLQLLPHIHGTDGFFMARFRK